jgi:hypothetical protein
MNPQGQFPAGKQSSLVSTPRSGQELTLLAISKETRHRLIEFLGVSTILVICLYMVFSEARGHLRTRLPGKTDNRMFLNVLLWDVKALQTGKPWHELWQMPNLYPEANVLATSEHMLGAAALFAPFYWLTGQPILSFNLMFALVMVLDFTCAYLVARRLLRSSLPAVFCAVLFTFSSYRLYQILHLQLWLHFPTPVLFLAAIRTTDRPGCRWPLLAGVCLAGQFYFGMSLGYFAALMVGLIFVSLVFYNPRLFLDPRFICRLGIAGVVAIVLLLPLVGPYQEAAERWGTWRWNGYMAPFMPSWHNFFSPALDGDATFESLAVAAEKATYWGYLPWILCAAGTWAAIQQSRRRGESIQFWAIASILLVASLCCITVNHFGSYKLLFEWLPGFSALRVPGRLALLTLWPCGLLGGWGLAWFGKLFPPWKPTRRTVLSLGIIALVFLENYHRLDVLKQYWSDVRCPNEAFYAKVVRDLPPGPIATIPLGPGAGDPYPVAGAIAADWRPTLNVYTSRVPPWLPTLTARLCQMATPGQAAALMGEMRLRGIRYLILDKPHLNPRALRCWMHARTSAGQVWGQSVYEDDSNLVLDMGLSEAEASLPLDWASACGRENPGEGYIQGCGAVAFEPTMPLRPGNYEANFDMSVDEPALGVCQVNRIFFDSQEPPQPDWRRRPLTLASAPLKQRGQTLRFVVPQEKGPEPILQFRVVHEGNGTLRVRQVLVTLAK